MDNFLKADKLVQDGLVHHLKGETDLAFSLYEEALSLNPNQAGAHNLTADIYLKLGNHLKALYHANLAISFNRDPNFLNTRALIFIEMKKFDDALSDLRASLKLGAKIPEIHNNLCVVYRHFKEFKKAVAHAQSALELRPNFINAWINLAAVKQDQGELREAQESLNSVIALDGQNLTALSNLAKVHYLSGNVEEAISFSKRAIGLGYIDLDLYFPLTHALIQSGQHKEAAYTLVRGFQDDRLAAYVQLPNILQQEVFFKVLYDCCQYLAGVEGNFTQAVNLYTKSIERAPGIASACWINLSSIYFQLHRFQDSIQCCEEAIKVNPAQIWAYSNIGVCYISLGESEQAIKYFERALLLDKNFAPALGWLLKEKAHICDWKNYDAVRNSVSALSQTNNTSAIAPFTALAAFNDPVELLYWARLSANDLFNSAISNIVLDTVVAKADPARKIRIGYYSFDFRNHPVAHLTARLFEVHNHDRFDIYAYSYGPDDGSTVRARIKANVKEFIDVRELSVIDTAKRIASDDIDILIDLTGNTQHNRSQVFALRPARIHAHWLGFVGTMGSKYYDYIIADDIVAPLGDEPYFDEQVLRLPSGMHIMDDSRKVEISHQTRAAHGLPDLGVVFGCFCQTFKIQPEIFSAWMEILKAVPGSVLWLASGPKGAIENLQASAVTHGVDPKRIIVAQRCDMEEYLSRFVLIDIYLDTFPYTSGTVASDALLMGCPLLTLSGKTMVSRMAGSILNHAGLPDLVAYTQQDYIQKAIALAQNSVDRERIKNALLIKQQQNKLLNTRQCVRELEELIEKIHLKSK